MTRFSGEPTVNPDATLVGRLAAREMDAAAELYDRYAPQVYALARRIVRNDGDAEDVVQDVFSQAWRTAASYDRQRGSVIGWLLMMTRTRSIDEATITAGTPSGGRWHSAR